MMMLGPRTPSLLLTCPTNSHANWQSICTQQKKKSTTWVTRKTFPLENKARKKINYSLVNHNQTHVFWHYQKITELRKEYHDIFTLNHKPKGLQGRLKKNLVEEGKVNFTLHQNSILIFLEKKRPSIHWGSLCKGTRKNLARISKCSLTFTQFLVHGKLSHTVLTSYRGNNKKNFQTDIDARLTFFTTCTW